MQRICLLALLVFVVRPAVALWVDMPLEQVVHDSPVVVVGEIKRIEPAKPATQPGPRRYDMASIAVTKVLKNTLPDLKIVVGDELPLSLPAKGGMAISTDIHHAVGKNGIWILERKDGTFWATYPKDFQPLDKEAEIQAIIEKGAAGSAAPSPTGGE